MGNREGKEEPQRGRRFGAEIERKGEREKKKAKHQKTGNEKEDCQQTPPTY